MSDEINKRLSELTKKLTPEAMAKEGYKTFVPETPIKTGAARRKTRVSGDTIHANYAYATRLEQGSSKQSPEGMSAPTIEAVITYIKKQ